MYAPLVVRLVRVALLERAIRDVFEREGSGALQRQELGTAFTQSPLAYQWSEFLRRWQSSNTAEPAQEASMPELSRAPVRFADVLDEHPMLPPGPRRSLLPALPGLFLASGIVGVFAGLGAALPDLSAAAASGSTREMQLGLLAEHVGLALQAGLFGLLLSIVAAITARLLEGAYDARCEALDGWVQLAYGALSPSELAARTGRVQAEALSALREEVGRLIRVVRNRDTLTSVLSGGGSSTSSASSAGGAAPEELERALERALGGAAGRAVDGVREALDQQSTRIVTALASALEQMPAPAAAPVQLPEDFRQVASQLAVGAAQQSRAGSSIEGAADAVGEASDSLRAAAMESRGLVGELREAAGALARAAEASSGASAGSSEQLDAIRAGLDSIGSGLKTSLDQVASRIDNVLGAVRSEAATPQPAGPELGQAIDALGARIERTLGSLERSLEQGRGAAPEAPEPTGADAPPTPPAGVPLSALETPMPPIETPPHRPSPASPKGSLSGLISRMDGEPLEGEGDLDATIDDIEVDDFDAAEAAPGESDESGDMRGRLRRRRFRKKQ